MVRIEVDAETARKIEQSTEPIELFDDRGRRIGFFPGQFQWKRLPSSSGGLMLEVRPQVWMTCGNASRTVATANDKTNGRLGQAR